MAELLIKVCVFVPPYVTGIVGAYFGHLLFVTCRHPSIVANLKLTIVTERKTSQHNKCDKNSAIVTKTGEMVKLVGRPGAWCPRDA